MGFRNPPGPEQPLYEKFRKRGFCGVCSRLLAVAQLSVTLSARPCWDCREIPLLAESNHGQDN